MEMITINLTEEQKRNLLIFLSRVQLTGQEAREFLNLCEIIDKSEKQKGS